MATLREYYETDFSHTARMHVKLPFGTHDLEAAVLYDFSGHIAFFSCYVSGQGLSLDYFVNLIGSLNYGNTQMQLDSRITLPSAKQFPGELKVENKPDFEILARFFGDPTWLSTKDMHASRRIFIYSESELSEDKVLQLKEAGRKLGHEVQFRSDRHVESRNKFEIPLAFISHDSRDKDAVARKIAINLKRMLCPVWYDEFSLKVGDSLREGIEKGLKECKKCILILSPNFLSNNGWTKKEFDSIFTREILTDERLVLPVWYKVTKELIFDYSPSLLNVKGVDWDALGEEEVCRQLYRVIVDDQTTTEHITLRAAD